MNNVIHLIYADETSFKLSSTNLSRILRKGTRPHAGSYDVVDLGGMGNEMIIEKHFDVLGIIGVASGIDVLDRAWDDINVGYFMLHVVDEGHAIRCQHDSWIAGLLTFQFQYFVPKFLHQRLSFRLWKFRIDGCLHFVAQQVKEAGVEDHIIIANLFLILVDILLKILSRTKQFAIKLPPFVVGSITGVYLIEDVVSEIEMRLVIPLLEQTAWRITLSIEKQRTGGRIMIVDVVRIDAPIVFIRLQIFLQFKGINEMNAEIRLLCLGTGINGTDAFQSIEHPPMPSATIYHENVPALGFLP